jgi:hypothetical protein
MPPRRARNGAREKRWLMRALQTSPSSCGSFCLRLRTALHYAGRPCCANVLAALEDCWNTSARRPYCHRRVQRSRRPLTEKTQRALCRRDHGRSPRGKQTLTTLPSFSTPDQTPRTRTLQHASAARPRAADGTLCTLSGHSLLCHVSDSSVSLDGFPPRFEFHVEVSPCLESGERLVVAAGLAG